MRRAHPDQRYSEDWNEATVVAPPTKLRSKVACGTCRRRKLRCSGQSPCSQCQASNQICTFSRPSRTTSISSRCEELSGRPGQPAPEVMSRPAVTAADDTMPSGLELDASAAPFSPENQWLTANPPLMTPDLTHIVQPSQLRSQSHGQQLAAPELSQFRASVGWLPSHGSLVLGDSQSFENGGYGMADFGPADSLWHLENFVSSAKANSSASWWTEFLILALGYRLLAGWNGFQLRR